ncbi:NAD(P)-dependent alcohol dehydrogenase [Streptomyces sp. H39-S7]|uniref:NAD(P)-dependent alcohol dehydrogenase n=1 Tax=Streptomyces sp. H39-S7 TaxID=3004357 RepID=UPI0022AF94E4|nr:NAD(P)-dependent alcohol dehydrogenase [Streptomyces sp. H39-S7]MCZ4124380.1 NAD(P)-dependent alcohol dehydrogenase [Streptomyces sp. H39-S7]
MKAVVQDSYGSADVLEVRDIEPPAVGAGEVRLRVRAASAGVGDRHVMTGLPYLIRVFGYGLRRPKARVRGMDVAGSVEEAGADVTRFRPGDEVFGTCDGSFAEYACARQDRITHQPANLTAEQAAAVPSSGVAALQGLRDRGRIQSGQSVLVIGAGGAVGTFAVQLAKAFGARVTGVCSTAKTDLVRSLGADEVIDYTQEDFADGVRRYDLILDTGGNRPLSLLRRALTPRGTLVIVGAEGGGRWLQGSDRQLRAMLLSPFLRQRLRGLMSVQREKDLRFLAELIEEGRLTPVIDRTYPLSAAADAMRHLDAGHGRGKVVITVM